MSHSPAPDLPTDSTFRTQRVLPFAPERIYDAFANPELLAQWWGPDGFTNTFEIFEFKEGGRWKFIMHGPNGANHPNENVFRKLEPASTIVIEHVCQPHFLLTVSLSPHEDGTVLTWTQKLEDPAFAVRLAHIIEPANEQNLNRLQAVLAETDTAS